MLGGLVLLRRLGRGIGRCGRRGSGDHFRSSSRGRMMQMKGLSLRGIRCRRESHHRLSGGLLVAVGGVIGDCRKFGNRGCELSKGAQG